MIINRYIGRLKVTHISDLKEVLISNKYYSFNLQTKDFID